ncbi:MAG: sugar-transfer associated ATP-grasp domain-containing protein [Coriobacteriaceae bacterium]|nr:sugar-transfer associated ATP-grasp domain-containing protein [Coriobacteriaceae bacterium]
MDMATEQAMREVLDAPSLYPEAPRKDRAQREAEMREWFEKYDEVNKCYNLYGMDRADAAPCDSWLDLKTFGKHRYAVNSSYAPAGSAFKFNHTLITRNKLVFEMFLSYWYGDDSGVYMPSVAVFLDRDFYQRGRGSQRMEPAVFADFVKRYDTGQRLVFKEVFGQKGKQVCIAQVDGGNLVVDGETLAPDAFAAQLAGDGLTWIVQDYIFQHEVMSNFNPTSVNTLRIVTYHTGERCFVEDAAVRMGYPGELVDNAFSDGFYTNIDSSGKLDESLFNFSMKTRRIHEWQDVRIPAAAEAFQFCVDLHSRTPELFSVGWDIAITKEGKPLVIEANDSWAVFVTQTAIGHAARPAWERYLAERQAFDAAIVRS